MTHLPSSFIMRKGSVGNVVPSNPNVFETDHFCHSTCQNQQELNHEDEVSTAIDAHEQHSVISSQRGGRSI